MPSSIHPQKQSLHVHAGEIGQRIELGHAAVRAQNSVLGGNENALAVGRNHYLIDLRLGVRTLEAQGAKTSAVVQGEAADGGEHKQRVTDFANVKNLVAEQAVAARKAFEPGAIEAAHTAECANPKVAEVVLVNAAHLRLGQSFGG